MICSCWLFVRWCMRMYIDVVFVCGMSVDSCTDCKGLLCSSYSLCGCPVAPAARPAVVLSGRFGAKLNSLSRASLGLPSRRCSQRFAAGHVFNFGRVAANPRKKQSRPANQKRLSQRGEQGCRRDRQAKAWNTYRRIHTHTRQIQNEIHLKPSHHFNHLPLTMTHT